MKKLVLALILAFSLSQSVYADLDNEENEETEETYEETLPERTKAPIEGLEGFYVVGESYERAGDSYVCDENGERVSGFFMSISREAELGNTLEVTVAAGMSDLRMGLLNSNFKLIVPCEYGRVEVKEQNGIIYAEAPCLFSEGVDYYDLEGNKIENLYELINSTKPTEAAPSGNSDLGCDLWAENDIKTAIENKIVPENLQSDYKAKITREEFCCLAMEIYFQKKGGGLVWQGELENPSSPFADTDEISVSRAYILGIVSGTGEGKFSPDAFITRQEAAVMLLSLAKALEIDHTVETVSPFVDESYFADWAKDSIYKICGIKSSSGTPIMAGTGEGKFSPWFNYQRQQAIATMKRIYETPANTSEDFRQAFKADIDEIAASYKVGSLSESLFSGEAYSRYIAKWQGLADTSEKSNYVTELDDAYKTTALYLSFCDYLYNNTDDDKAQISAMADEFLSVFVSVPYMTEDEILNTLHGAGEFDILEKYGYTDKYYAVSEQLEHL